MTAITNESINTAEEVAIAVKDIDTTAATIFNEVEVDTETFMNRVDQTEKVWMQHKTIMFN